MRGTLSTVWNGFDPQSQHGYKSHPQSSGGDRVDSLEKPRGLQTSPKRVSEKQSESQKDATDATRDAISHAQKTSR